MKILIVAGHNPFLHTGGTEMVITLLAKSFSLLGHSVYITVEGEVSEGNIPSGVTLIPLTPISFPVLRDLHYAWQVRNSTNSLNPDLVIDNLAIAFLNSMKYPTASIAHGTNLANAFSRSLRSYREIGKYLFRIFQSFLQYTLFHRCHMIIAVSKKVKKEIESYYHVKSEKIVIIENGTRFSLTQEERSHRFNRNTLRTGIFISSNHQWKGISIVEELATLMKDYRFFICGGPYTSKQQNIEYRGNLSHEDLLNTMHSSDFLILPSQYEGQSLAVLEAMSLGLVIVGGKEIDPFIGDTNSMGIILANRKNVSEYRDRMRWLESNPETIHRIQEYNMRITGDYTWEKQGRRYSSEFVRVFPHLPWNT